MDPGPNARGKAARPQGDRRPLTVRCHGLTHPGRARPANEDQFLIVEVARAVRVRQGSLPLARLQYGDRRGRLFAVADGLGGARGGEEASALALQVVGRCLLNSPQNLLQGRTPVRSGVLPQLRAAFRLADAQVIARSARHPALTGMGTTLTLAYSVDRDLYVGHVGDSRCYLLHRGKLRQLTRDHTWAQGLVDGGQLLPGEVHRHRLRHVITNVVGGPVPGVKPELRVARLAPGDALLLCTDGLTDLVSDDTIALILGREADPRAACEELVARANERGGRDNVTVIVARYGA
jgi:protein phosphatase